MEICDRDTSELIRGLKCLDKIKIGANKANFGSFLAEVKCLRSLINPSSWSKYCTRYIRCILRIWNLSFWDFEIHFDLKSAQFFDLSTNVDFWRLVLLANHLQTKFCELSHTKCLLSYVLCAPKIWFYKSSFLSRLSLFSF